MAYDASSHKAVSKAIGSWSPRIYSDPVADFTRQVVTACSPPSAARARALIHSLARLATYCDGSGLTLSPETVLAISTIERFLATSPRRYSPATLRTVATNLRAMRRCLVDEDRPDPLILSRERAKAPYCPAEIDHYLTLAFAQPTPSRRHRATALICLGAGAGLSGADLRYVHGTDVQQVPGGLVVDVAGIHPRRVPVLAHFHRALIPAAKFAGENFITGGADRARRNVTSGLIASLAGGADLPALDMRRLRSTWLTSVAEATGLNAFMAAAGVDCSQRLGDIVSYLAPMEEARAVRLLGGKKW